MERSFFKGKLWKEHSGVMGAVPINTPQKISYERLAPGYLPLLSSTNKPINEQLQSKQTEELQSSNLVEFQKKQAPLPKPTASTNSLEAEDRDKLAKFDLQDIPYAMDKIGWPIAAKVARKWFASPKHIYNDQPNSVQSIDDITVSLKWALKFGSVGDKFNQLMREKIYSEKAVSSAKKKIMEQVKQRFVDQNAGKFSFDTTPFIHDLRQFHIDWQIQFQAISTSHTLDGLYMTDLTGTLGNFNIYVAIGHLEVTAEQYFKYNQKAGTKAYCIDATAAITYVYAYWKDDYSFNDKHDSFLCCCYE